MKKKRIYLGIVAAVAISVLTITAFAANSSYEGYDKFKSLIKTQKDYSEYKDGTITGKVQVIDNGETIADITGTMNGNFEDKEMNGEVVLAINDLEKTLELFKMDDMFYISDVENNDVYVKENTNEYDHDDFRREEKHSFTESQEALVDFVMNDLKDDFVLVSNEDGSKNISFELTKDEVPVGVNLLASAASSKRLDNKDGHFENSMEEELNIDDYPLFKELSEAKIDHANIVENMEIDYVKITVDADENDMLQAFTVSLTVSGNDEDGEFHELTINAELEISNVNTATIAAVDLDGKNIIELPEMERKMEHGRGMKGIRK
jgi:hypothetical protein